MSDNRIYHDPEGRDEAAIRRKQRIQEMKRRKRRAEILYYRIFPAGIIVLILLIILFMLPLGGKSEDKSAKSGTESGMPESNKTVDIIDVAGQSGLEVDQEGRQDLSGIEMNQDGETEQTGQAGTIDRDDYNGQHEIYGPTRPQPYGPEAPEGWVMKEFQLKPYLATSDDRTAGFGEDILSEHGMIIDLTENRVLASRDAQSRISPASMTKILTVLTAAKALGIKEDDPEKYPVLSDTFTITIDITDYSYVNDCSNVGFDIGETPTIRDLFYGTILPSGADAALGLAIYVAGSHEAFVDMMNENLRQMGLSASSHFTNCAGLYNEEHYSTIYDIAVMMKEASDIPFLRKVMSARTYRTSSTPIHPDGLLISNWFLRRIEDKDTHGEVLCAKTGFVVQSRNCAASLANDGEGREYICVTAGAPKGWACILDHVALYQKYLKAESTEETENRTD